MKQIKALLSKLSSLGNHLFHLSSPILTFIQLKPIQLRQRIETERASNARLKLEMAERQQIENALRESEEQLRLALDAAQMGIWNWNILTNAVTWSRQVETIFGLEPGEFAGTYQAYLALVPAADRARVEQTIAETLAGVTADYHIEHRIIWPDGSLHWLEANGCLYRDEANQPIHMTGAVADITSRKQAEIALQESRAFLHSIYTGMGMAIFVVDVAPDGTFRYVGANPAYEQMANLKSSDLEGRSPEDIIPLLGSEVIAVVRRNYEECLRANHIIYKEFRVIWQGQETWYLDQLTPIHDSTGRVVRIIGSTINTTEIKQAEIALRQSQQQHQTLVNSIDGIVWEADAQTFQFSFVSQQAERLLGYPVERWLTESTFWADHIHPADRAEALDFCLAATAAKNNHEFEYRMITADNRAVWLRDIVTVTVENDQPVKLQGIMVDITQSKQADAALNRYANRLEVLHEIDRVILATHSLPEIAQTALRYLRQLLPCQRIGLTLLDAENQEIVSIMVEVEYETQLKAGRRMPAEQYEYIIAELQQGKIFEHTNLHLLPDGHVLFNEGIRAGVSLPLIANEALIGAINLFTNATTSFSQEDLNIAREIADQLAIAIRQAQLFEAEAQRRQEAEALRDTAAALNNTLDLQEVLDRILANVGRVVQYDAADIMLIEAGVARIVRHHSHTSRASKETRLDLGLTIAEIPNFRQMMESGQPSIIPDTRTHAEWVDIPESRWIRSYASTPIRTSSKIIGFLSVASETSGFFKPAVAERLQAFANQAAVTLENARLYTEAEQRAEHLAVLHELDQAISASLDIDHVYETFAQQTLRLLPYDFMSINLVQQDDIHAAYTTGKTPLATMGIRMPLKVVGGSKWVIEQGQALLSTNLAADERPVAYQPTIERGIQSVMILPLRVKGLVIGTWFLGHQQLEAYQAADLTIAQSMADQLAIAIENARLFEQVQRYAEALEQRVVDRTRELSALYDVTAVASESLDLPTTLKRSLEEVLGAMRSQAGTIHLLDETGQILHLAVQQGLPLELAPALERLPAGDSLPGWVITHGDPLIVPDLAFEPRAAQTSGDRFQAYIGAPMRARGQVLGVLSVARAREQSQFNPEEVALLTTIADQVGIVVESARLRQLAEQSAVIEERARLARDLHDSVTQLLYSVNLFATVGHEAYKLGDLAQVNNCLDELGLAAQQALKEMRLLVYELRPLALAQEGLVGALRQRLDAVERRTGVQTQLQADIMLDLPGQIEEALYHIAQEALNNALKHAAASEVTVSIEADERWIELEVTDNGSGFDLGAAEGKGGLGLTSMRERVEKLGGMLTILSRPGEGTKIKVRIE